MSLSNEQVNLFRDNGYVTVERFFTPDEARAMQLEIDRFKRAGLVRNVATDGDGKTTSQSQKNLQLCPMFDKSDILRLCPSTRASSKRSHNSSEIPSACTSIKSLSNQVATASEPAGTRTTPISNLMIP